MAPFLMKWLKSKNGSESTIKKMFDSHSLLSKTNIVAGLNKNSTAQITLDKTLLIAAQAIENKNYQFAKNILSKISVNLTPLQQDKIVLMKSMVACNQNDCDLAESFLKKIKSTSKIYFLGQLELALISTKKNNYKKSLKIIKKLSNREFINRLNKNAVGYLKLVQALNLGYLGEVELANVLLNSLKSSPALYQHSLAVKSEILLKNNQLENALFPLLLLQKSKNKPSDLSYSKIKILNILTTLNEQWQATQFRENFISELLILVNRDHENAKIITSSHYLKRIMRRSNSSEKIKFKNRISWNSIQLITEIQRNNNSTKMLVQSRKDVTNYNFILNKGQKSWLKNIGKYLATKKHTKLKVKSNATVSRLEYLLTKLVGIPKTDIMRYQLLDGLSIWTKNKTFEQRWWLKEKTTVKFKEVNVIQAQKALIELLNIPKKRLQTLFSSHIDMISSQMRKTPKQITIVLADLKKQKYRLKKRLSLSLQHDANNLVIKHENQLLWLVKQNLSENNTFKKIQHRYTIKNSIKNQIIITQLSKLIEKKSLSLKKTIKALKLLSLSASTSAVKSMALFILADAHVTNVQQLNNDGFKSQLPIKGSLSQAIKIYQRLLLDSNNKFNKAVILYQLARAYELSGKPKKSLEQLNKLSVKYPLYKLGGEISFRRAELYFSLGDYKKSSKVYSELKNNSGSRFYFKAKYKLAWSYYKSGYYEKSITNFFKLLDQKTNDNQELSSRIYNDIIRICAIAFSNANGIDSVVSFFENSKNLTHRKAILLELVKYYKLKKRYSDTVKTLSQIIKLYPGDSDLHAYQTQIVASYISAGFNEKIWFSRMAYISQFGGDSQYWKNADSDLKNKIRPFLKKYLLKMAQRDHFKAQSTGNKKYYYSAIKWYKTYLRDVLMNENTAEIYFLLAQAYRETAQYDLAVEMYQKAAYEFPKFDYNKRKKAAYSALLAYHSKYNNSTNVLDKKIIKTEIQLSNRYLYNFGSDKNIVTIRTKMAENYLKLSDNKAALLLSKKIITANVNQKLLLANWRIIAHASYYLSDFTSAEKYYRLILKSKIADKNNIVIRLAQAIYKQAESAKNSDNLLLAIKHFKRIATVAKNTDLHIKAEFEIATLQIILKQWKKAIVSLENFKIKFKHHPLQKNIDEKLVLVYENNADWKQAAYYLQVIFKREGKSELARNALWRSAKLYEKAGEFKRSFSIYKKYVKLFPTPPENAFEARDKLVAMSIKLKNKKLEYFWLKNIITIYNKNNSEKTDRMVYLASKSSLSLAINYKKQLDKIKLKLPLANSLKRKQKIMKITLKYLNDSISYELIDHSTRATMLIAEIYQNLALDVANSPRPKNLTPLEMQQYEILLEDQVIPFEDKAIGFYVHNIAQIKNGIYTAWIKKSLDALRQLMPARYLKTEKIVGYYDAIQ
ncbi:hypothetical protein MNBD_GAMMA22-1966 [hydrothermal vent metagenome]|uniref:Uncharacterized protein n=1 Tax=hydrothermal vent metagenome TaxID=652676 RepID=A0A3B1B5B3_9ZZZZ